MQSSPNTVPLRAAPVLVAVLAAVLLASGCAQDDGDERRAQPTTSTSARLPTSTTTEPGRATCSASELDADLTEQSELPGPVAETRRRIAEAAVACDFDALQALALSGDEPFTYSFGDSGTPASFWRRQEERADEQPGPLRMLVEILDRPYGVVDDHGTQRYAWPSAFTYDSWEAVPEEARQALKPLYDEKAFAFFERFGGYIGHRVVILEDGTWTVFVAGD